MISSGLNPDAISPCLVNISQDLNRPVSHMWFQVYALSTDLGNREGTKQRGAICNDLVLYRKEILPKISSFKELIWPGHQKTGLGQRT